MAHWLDTAWLAFDRAVLQGIHNLAVAMGGQGSFFDWFMRFISLLGEEGIGLIILGVLLFCFKKTRKAGMCLLLGMLCGLFITNIVIKNLVARPRPFQNTEVAIFREWWSYIGGPNASEKSFPSGHTTHAMAAMTAIFLNFPKKYSWTAYIFVLLTGLSRMFLVVHYPSDILGGLLAGALAATGGWFITCGLLALLRRHEDNAFCRGFLSFDLAVPMGRLYTKITHRDAKNETNDAQNAENDAKAAPEDRGTDDTTA